MSLKNRQRIGSWAGIFAVMGTVLSPAVASAVSSTANTTINASLGSTISVSTSTTVTIGVTPTSGGALSSSSDTVSVSTNNTLGYNLTLLDADTNTNLVNGGNTIAASSNITGAGGPATLAVNTWGFAVAGNTGFDASYSAETNAAASTTKWAGVLPSSGTAYSLKNTSAVASGDTTTVWYAVKATTAKPNGTYSDTVTYTATTN